jgi:hypothetical protein
MLEYSSRLCLALPSSLGTPHHLEDVVAGPMSLRPGKRAVGEWIVPVLGLGNSLCGPVVRAGCAFADLSLAEGPSAVELSIPSRSRTQMILQTETLRADDGT